MIPIIKLVCRSTFRWPMLYVMIIIATTLGLSHISNYTAPITPPSSAELMFPLENVESLMARRSKDPEKDSPAAAVTDKRTTRVPTAVPTRLSYDQQQLHCLTQNIYYEAGHEIWEGKLAVGQVTANRVQAGKFGRDICAVVFQRSSSDGVVSCQFTWTCRIAQHGALDNRTWAESEAAARAILRDGVRLDDLTGALFFHNNSTQPQWKLRRLRAIGNHIFYGYL